MREGTPVPAKKQKNKTSDLLKSRKYNKNTFYFTYFGK